MMRNPTDEEIDLINKLFAPNLSKKDKEAIIERLKEIDDEKTKDYPFCH